MQKPVIFYNMKNNKQWFQQWLLGPSAAVLATSPPNPQISNRDYKLEVF
jgi:hypothetical protein